MTEKTKVQAKWITGNPELDAKRRELPLVFGHPLWEMFKARLQDIDLPSAENLDQAREVLAGLGVNVDKTLAYFGTFGAETTAAIHEITLASYDGPEESIIGDLVCPGCRHTGRFSIRCDTYQEITHEGSDTWEGSAWEDDYFCQCTECGHHATVNEFRIGNQIPRVFRVRKYYDHVFVYDVVAVDVPSAVRAVDDPDTGAEQSGAHEYDELITEYVSEYSIDASASDHEPGAIYPATRLYTVLLDTCGEEKTEEREECAVEEEWVVGDIDAGAA